MAVAKKNYQVLSAELDEILARLQDPATDVDEALKLHEHGQVVIKELEAYLKHAQNSIRMIKSKKGA
jgi:exodeoxyribonuclease VII small subunit